MGRLGTAEEIASLVVYLASDEVRHLTEYIHITLDNTVVVICVIYFCSSLQSAFVTGETVVIDGGWTL